MQKILVTGGLGFIGTNFVRMQKSDCTYIVCDSMTYASHRHLIDHPYDNLKIEKADIRDQAIVQRIMRKYKPDAVFHFAAESHVCRSIAGPKDFITTNIMGTWNLLEEWRFLHSCHPQKKFVHISTDEVFGELSLTDPPFNEESPLKPRSPYASSKAASDMLALSYSETYGLPVIVTNCSNNFGPFQHEEKLIPATINRLLGGYPAVLYGNGQQVRDWIYAPDHCNALWDIFVSGEVGQRYCVGGNTEKRNVEIVEDIWRIIRKFGLGSSTLEVVHDAFARPTDDRRYAIDTKKIEALGIEVKSDYEKNLQETVGYYCEEYKNHKR